MKKITLLLFSLLAFNVLFSAQETILEGRDADTVIEGAEMIRYTEKSTLPSYIKMRKGKEIPFAQAEHWFKTIMELSDDHAWTLLNTTDDKLGMTHYRFQQTYKGYPVDGSMYILHAKAGKVFSANGEFFTSLPTTSSAAISKEDAINAAIGYVGAISYKWEFADEEHALRARTGDPMDTYYPRPKLSYIPVDGIYAGGEFRLAYRMDIYAQEPLSRAYIYVDALTGQVINKVERIHTADVVGTAVTKYSGSVSFTTDSYSGGYRLRESGRGNGIETFDMNTSTSYGAAVDFTDLDNYWNNVNAQQDEVATDAHWGAEMTYDYFWLMHGRNSIDNMGFKLESYVHYDNSYVNAFWDGSVMTYGDGSAGSGFTPLTALDVCGHEITHGLTNFTSNLIYSYESGALNESFSDIFGNTIENYARPADWSWINWRGYDIRRNS